MKTRCCYYSKEKLNIFFFNNKNKIKKTETFVDSTRQEAEQTTRKKGGKRGESMRHGFSFCHSFFLIITFERTMVGKKEKEKKKERKGKETHRRNRREK